MFQRNGAKEIKDFSEKFLKLRKDLDTAIGLNTNKDVHDISESQTCSVIRRSDLL